MSIHHPLSNEDITRIVPNCRFVPYEQLHLYTTLNQLLPTPKSKVVLLYQLAKVGHWICLFYNREGLQCFDSLGYRPDDELKDTDPELIHSKHQDLPYLTYLLAQSRVPVNWSPYKLQKHHTSTCGMWATIRMIYDQLGCDEFASCFRGRDFRRGIKDKDKTIAKLYHLCHYGYRCPNCHQIPLFYQDAGDFYQCPKCKWHSQNCPFNLGKFIFLK